MNSNGAFLKMGIREGLVDQEDVHLAMMEGRKFRDSLGDLRNSLGFYNGVLKAIGKGYDLRVNIPVLKQAISEGVFDQEDAFLIIMEGVKKARANGEAA